MLKHLSLVKHLYNEKNCLLTPKVRNPPQPNAYSAQYTNGRHKKTNHARGADTGVCKWSALSPPRDESRGVKRSALSPCFCSFL